MVDVTTIVPLGQALKAASLPVVVASDQIIPISATTLPLPTGAALDATLAAQSAKLPPTLGQTTKAASLSVAIASDQAVNVSSPGLSGAGTTTWTAVGTNQTAIPSTPLAGRATLLVQAWESNALPIFIGFTGLTARVLGAVPGAADGILLLPGQSYPISLAAATLLFSRATATGCYVGVQEVAAA